MLCCAVLLVSVQVSVEFMSPCGSLLLRCSGSSLSSPGWLAAWSDWTKAAAAPTETDAEGADSAAAAAAEGDLSSVEDGDDDLALGGGSSSSSKAALSVLLRQLKEGQQVRLAKRTSLAWMAGGVCRLGGPHLPQ
jgi:hypothetical protein